VQVINQEARRMQRMTEDLLELARLEAGQLPLQRQCLNLTSLLGDIFGRYATLRPRPDVQLHDRRVPEPLPVSADPDRLTQVVVNLLDNAIKFCGPGGQVELVSSHDETEACFWIANSGDGLAPEEVAQVFNRFYRTDHARAFVEGGTGLGLAIVRELVMAHGGRVWAESEQGSWVRFVVALPLCPDA
jgi:signal transduction histidine kinase